MKVLLGFEPRLFGRFDFVKTWMHGSYILAGYLGSNNDPSPQLCRVRGGAEAHGLEIAPEKWGRLLFFEYRADSLSL